MNTRKRFLVAMLSLTAVAAWGQQPGPVTYRCMDASGRSTYTNVQEEMAGKKCTVVSREVSVVPVERVPAPAAGAGRPGGTPAVTGRPEAARVRDSDRRRILQEELQTAEKLLADARQKLADQESQRNGDERNYQRVLDRLKPFQDEVVRAEGNVEALRRELGNLR